MLVFITQWLLSVNYTGTSDFPNLSHSYNGTSASTVIVEVNGCGRNTDMLSESLVVNLVSLGSKSKNLQYECALWLAQTG